MNKILWTIKGKEEKVSDEELIEMIKSGKLTKDDLIKNRDLKRFVSIADSIYGFYLKGETNEKRIIIRFTKSRKTYRRV